MNGDPSWVPHLARMKITEHGPRLPLEARGEPRREPLEVRASFLASIDVTIGNVCRTGCSHHHRHSAANGSAALVAMALAGGDGARHHVDAGWTGSVHRRRARPRH